jgi:hypothetical protein
MRKEFHATSSGSAPVLHVIVILVMAAAVVNGAAALFSSTPLDHNSVVEVLAGMFCLMILMVMVVSMARRPKDPPPLPPPPPLLIVIDDSGLWLKEVGELMRWSEIQHITVQSGSTPKCTIVWRDRSIRVPTPHYRDSDGTRWTVRPDPDYYRDGDGKKWFELSVYKEIRSYWKRYAPQP